MKDHALTRMRKLVGTDCFHQKVSSDYGWKVLARLIEDLKQFLSESEYRLIYDIMRHHDILAYKELSEAWTVQCISSSDTSIAVRRAKYQIAQLLKKFTFETSKDQRRATAKEKFFQAESDCCVFNIYKYVELISDDPFSRKLLKHARVFLKRLLGESVSGLSSQLLVGSRHGPGANLDTSLGYISSYHKYANWPYACTVDANRYALFALQTDQRWMGALYDSYRSRLNIPQHMPINKQSFLKALTRPVDANKITFVPKDAFTERTIAIEPSLNLYLQLGVDGFIRKRLKRFFVNLDSQEKNQHLARLGSIHGTFATIDLKSASDTVSTKLCELLLPEEWFRYLMDLRSPYGDMEGERISYEKISSMGNGYTFVLESAIFAAAIYAVKRMVGSDLTNDNFAVFGDDLIVPTSEYYRVVEALRLFGFRTNLEKTFSYGPFRESCGTDWFEGLPLRAVYLREKPKTVRDVICDYNRLKRLLQLRFDITESKTCSYIFSHIHPEFRSATGPCSDTEFDTYIHVEVPSSQDEYRKIWMYKYYRFTVMPVMKKSVGQKFLFRKLMATLRQTPIVENYSTHKLGAGGSSFVVFRRNSIRHGITTSHTSYWCGDYHETYPLVR